MSSETALLLAAATVGILHMSAPDHWATLLMLGKVERWGRSRLVGVGLVTAAGHVALSIALGFAIVGLGLAFSARLSGEVVQAVGLLMVIGGAAYAIKELRITTRKDYESETLEELAKGERRFGSRFGYFAVLGAALSPDLAILPSFVLAVPRGLEFALAIAVVFGLASVGTLISFLLLGMTGLGELFEKIPAKYNDALVGLVVASVGAYVVLFR